MHTILFYRIVTGILLMAISTVAMSETCPAVSEIIERKISNLYEWTVEEETSLDDLLSVNRLYSVRIHHDGEFVSCQYTARKWPVRLDAKPEVTGCRIVDESGDWQKTESGQLVCREKNLFSCEYRINCDKN